MMIYSHLSTSWYAHLLMWRISNRVRHVMLVLHTVPADWGWWPPSEGGLGAMMGVWLSPFSAGSMALWSTFDSDVTSLPASTCHTEADWLMMGFWDEHELVETLLRSFWYLRLTGQFVDVAVITHSQHVYNVYLPVPVSPRLSLRS